MAGQPAVFLDRDGTLIEEVGYLDRVDRIEWLPYGIDAVRLLNQAGYAVVIVTNQAGVARGLYGEADVQAVHAAIDARFARGGARIDAYYYCPHHPEGVVEAYRQACGCRKPATGMLDQARDALGIDVARSFVVGDRWSDVALGTRAGARGLLVRTGYGRDEEARPKADVTAVAVVDNLMAAVSWILRHR